MPLFQYFGWVGSFLLVALLAADWCFPAPIAPPSDVQLDHKFHIRIHTDHKWPERVVLDTTRATPVQDAKAVGETDVAGTETAILAKPRTVEALAEMAPPQGRVFDRRTTSRGAEQEPSPIGKGAPLQNRARLSVMARKGITLPNPLHKPPGRS